ADDPGPACHEHAHEGSLVADPHEALAQAVVPVWKTRRLRLLAPQDRVRGPGSRSPELGRRDPANPTREAGLLEDRLGEIGPGAVAVGRDVVEAVRQLDDAPRGLGEM